MIHLSQPPPIPSIFPIGGLSDKGYSSMTLDDKRSSLIIGSQDSLDSLSKMKGGGSIVSPAAAADHRAPLRRPTKRPPSSKCSQSKA